MIDKICIISEENDNSTNKVIDWLIYYDVKFYRVNNESDFFSFKILLNDNSLETNLDNFLVWNRRGYFPILLSEFKNDIWSNYLSKEQFVPIEFLEKSLKKIYGSFAHEINNNKIINLKLAHEVGFLIPDSIITNNKKDLVDFYKKNNGNCITKSMFKPPNLLNDEYRLISDGTVDFDIENIDDFFAPSLIQKFIKKKFEIRVFFIEDLIYSMAIFSDEMDVRKDFNCRNVLFSFPENEIRKIRSFIKKSTLNTGSMDILYDENDNYIFLEVNPMGQFDWLSHNCNYYIEKDIAKKFKNEIS